MGMRVVALCEEFLGINSELEILRKGGVVSGKILDKVLILDRQHRIKDRLIAGGTFLFRQVSNQINRVQSDMQPQPDRRQDGTQRGDRYDDYRDNGRGRGDRPVDGDRRGRDAPPSYADRHTSRREDGDMGIPPRRQESERRPEPVTGDHRRPGPPARNRGYEKP